MNTHKPFDNDDELEAEATAWLFERTEGFTPARLREYEAWLAADPRHPAALERVERTMALLEQLPSVRARLEERCAMPGAGAGARDASRRRRIIAFPAWATAIAAVLVVALVGWLTLRTPTHVRYVAEAAAPRRVTLGDGSVVNLNSGAVMRVQFAAGQRRVLLDTGEAHFQVAPDAVHPFIVTAAGVAVRAVGTAFNVRLAGTAVDVLVTEGKVDVAPPTTAKSAAPGAPSRVVAGERIVVEATRAVSALPEPQIQKVEPAVIRTTLAWQNPRVTFNDAPLSEVVAQFNQRNVTQLVLGDVELGGRRVGGVIALDQVEAFVRLLERDGDIAAERRGEQEIVLRRVR